jgi:hypothetical protein
MATRGKSSGTREVKGRAKEPLEKGERDVVLAYLQSCAKFWKMGTDSLQSWVATVKAGGIPEFGGNLLY